MLLQEVRHFCSYLHFSISNVVSVIHKDLEVMATEFFSWLVLTSHSTFMQILTFMQNVWRVLCLVLGIFGGQNRKAIQTKLLSLYPNLHICSCYMFSIICPVKFQNWKSSSYVVQPFISPFQTSASVNFIP